MVSVSRAMRMIPAALPFSVRLAGARQTGERHRRRDHAPSLAQANGTREKDIDTPLGADRNQTAIAAADACDLFIRLWPIMQGAPFDAPCIIG
jgi:hypothetical protein